MTCVYLILPERFSETWEAGEISGCMSEGIRLNGREKAGSVHAATGTFIHQPTTPGTYLLPS